MRLAGARSSAGAGPWRVLSRRPGRPARPSATSAPSRTSIRDRCASSDTSPRPWSITTVLSREVQRLGEHHATAARRQHRRAAGTGEVGAAVRRARLAVVDAAHAEARHHADFDRPHERIRPTAARARPPGRARPAAGVHGRSACCMLGGGFTNFGARREAGASGSPWAPRSATARDRSVVPSSSPRPTVTGYSPAATSRSMPISASQRPSATRATAMVRSNVCTVSDGDRAIAADVESHDLAGLHRPRVDGRP